MSIRGGWGDHKNWYGIKLSRIKKLTALQVASLFVLCLFNWFILR